MNKVNTYKLHDSHLHTTAGTPYRCCRTVAVNLFIRTPKPDVYGLSFTTSIFIVSTEIKEIHHPTKTQKCNVHVLGFGGVSILRVYVKI